MELERYYTPEQLEQLRERRETLGEEHIRGVERAWEDLARELEELRVAGTDPGDERVQVLRRRADELLAEFTGGDAGIHEAVGRVWRDQGPQQASRGVFTPELFAYLGEARAAR